MKTENELTLIDKEYKVWISQIKKQIRGAQIKASIAVNEDMLELYWSIGKDISEKSFEKNYGSKFFEKTSSELKTTFPNAQGFSVTNLKYMKRFYKFYEPIRHQLGDEFNAVVFTIPWRHHIEIFTRAKSIDEALFFVSKTKENGWSRAMLINMMDTKLFETRGNTINNFALTLPENESECAKEILKDEYKFDFLSMSEKYEEKDLHKGLEQNLIQFLLELGNGFAFVGSHVPFVVNGDDYELDLLFYHLELRCYVVVELKITELKKEHIGQIQIYMNYIDENLRKINQDKTIGIIICKQDNKYVIKYCSDDRIIAREYELV